MAVSFTEIHYLYFSLFVDVGQLFEIPGQGNAVAYSKA